MAASDEHLHNGLIDELKTIGTISHFSGLSSVTPESQHKVNTRSVLYYSSDIQ